MKPNDVEAIKCEGKIEIAYGAYIYITLDGIPEFLETIEAEKKIAVRIRCNDECKDFELQEFLELVGLG